MTTRLSSRPFAAREQRGVVLIVALLFLVLVTMLAITASGTSLLQQKLAGGQRNAQLAEWSAETALRAAEWRLWRASSDAGTRMQCGSGSLSNCYNYAPDPTAAVATFRTATGWVTDGATQFTDVDYTTASTDNTFKLKYNPYYLIEDLGPELPPGAGIQHESGATGSTGTGYTSTTRHVYRITARGVGNNENAIRVLETTFAAKSD
ncbi:pilus assembly PilX family protein [Luteibacter aegosomatissinici]|uniref:pilus assembly PilX family protein n=1 Tax=Luteibacter aegosomatissinici TaxID=2911539 RepID=UPI001FF75D39|nr:PilX N-terminal domain-containing pilus assembly protein [Luteibacter aegosomatissinici]UPG93366.1 PilX N-terminal domain-containing pilus assembly protein [Luteibacter aegosomatissinici]